MLKALCLFLFVAATFQLTLDHMFMYKEDYNVHDPKTQEIYGMIIFSNGTFVYYGCETYNIRYMVGAQKF
jgi:hypothetical protein